MKKNNLLKSLVVLLFVSSTSYLSADDSTSLDEVKVVTTASGFEQNIADAPASISVVSSEELKNKSYTNVTDVLKNIPGVYVTGGGSNQAISIRGMSSAYTLYLIDGRPMQGNDAFSRSASLGGNAINFLPPLEAIERIEIIRGPASSLYGSDAMGGVINIITKKHSNKVTASIKTEYKKSDAKNILNNDTSNTSFYINAPLINNALLVQVTGGYLKTDESNYQRSGGSLKTGSEPEFLRKNIGTKIVYTPDTNNTITAGYDYRVMERTSNPGKSIPLLNARNRKNEVSYLKSIKDNYNITHEAKYDKFLINSYVQYDKDSNPTNTNNATGNSIIMDTITANTQGSYFFDTNTLTVGLNYKNEVLKDGSTNAILVNGKKDNSISVMRRYQVALFAEDTWQALDDLAFTFSGRYDYNEKFKSNFSPKAYAIYSILEDLNFKAGVTTGYKAPSLRQVSPNFASSTTRGGNANITIIGNKDLKPEKSLSYESGFAYDNPNIGLSLSLMLFQTNFQNKIQAEQAYNFDGSILTQHNGETYEGGVQYYKNVDKAQIKGIELASDYYILSSLKYRHSYTFTISEQKSGNNIGKPLNDMPKHMFNAGLDFNATNKLSLWTQVNYRSKTSGTAVSVTNGFVEGTPSYTFWDIGLVYKYDKNLSFSSGIYNMTNKNVVDDGNKYVLDGRMYSFALNMAF